MLRRTAVDRVYKILFFLGICALVGEAHIQSAQAQSALGRMVLLEEPDACWAAETAGRIEKGESIFKGADLANFGHETKGTSYMADGPRVKVGKTWYRKIPCPPTPAGGWPGGYPTYGVRNTAFSSPISVSLSGGPSWTHLAGKYASTGAQAPFSGNANATGGDLCAGVNGYWPIPGTIFEYGGGVNVCDDFTGKTTLFDIVRHGLTGHVTATVDPGARVEPYIGVHAAFSDPAKTQAYLRMGPVFAENKLTINSNQVPGGGIFQSASSSYWTTGFGLQTGVTWPLCANCVFGLPLSGGIGGKFAWYTGSHSVSVQSAVFGFTETATVDKVTQYAVIGTLSVPLAAPH